MYSLTLDTQEYEEPSSQLSLYNIISQLLFYQSSLTPPPNPTCPLLKFQTFLAFASSLFYKRKQFVADPVPWIL